MGKPYFAEISRLIDTFRWSVAFDITTLQKAIASTSTLPLLAIGSGGSLSAAQLLIGLHRYRTGRISTIATPLEIKTELLDSNTAVWLLSAGGRNIDIRTGFSTLVQQEPKQFGVICGQSKSPLVSAAQSHPFVDLIHFDLPAGKDGFLATNSLLAFATLFARAYSEEFTTQKSNIITSTETILSNGRTSKAWRLAVKPLWNRETTVVLHSPHSRPGAIDLESKFTEAAIGHLQLADYRNFAHGRHHWLAKKGAETGILAFVTPDDQQLADRTLALIPKSIPIAKINLEGNPETIGLHSIIASLLISGWAGEARGIDPGRPGVPDFGRKLYHLSASIKRIKASKGTSLIDARIIERKAGINVEKLISRGDFGVWRSALQSFKKQLTSTMYAGVIFDYDGTLVDTRERFSPPRNEVMKEINRLLKSGVQIAVATGRGESFRRDFRIGVPPSLWNRILVGYYNGAEIGGLGDETIPNGTSVVCDILKPISTLLREQPELAKIAVQTDRQFQITLKPVGFVPEHRLWDIANQTVISHAAQNLKVVRSSHSIDILAPRISKRGVINKLKELCGNQGAVLTIGDRGRWPGNDFELLNEPCSLSVDESSPDPQTCWNIASPGQRGLAATLQYLTSLEGISSSSTARFIWNVK